MLLDYQNNNLNHLEMAIREYDTISVIGQPKSGRKTVVSNLKLENSISINIFHYTNQPENYGDFLFAIKNNSTLTQSSYGFSPEISIGDILSIGIEKKEFFELEKHLLKNIKRISKRHKIVLVVNDYNNLDNGTKTIIRKILTYKQNNKLKNRLITIFICNESDHSFFNVDKKIYFDKLAFKQKDIDRIFTSLNLNSNIILSEEVKCFILKNANGNIELISSIVDDFNHQRIDKELALIDTNDNIEKLVNSNINTTEFADKLRYILNIITISDKYFSNLDLSFLLSEEINLIDVYMQFATKNSLVDINNNCYQIIFGIIKKIFSTISETQKLKIYNDIVKLINMFYPNQYKEKYTFSKLAKNPKANIYLLQMIFQKIRKEGTLIKEQYNLSKEENDIVDEYFNAYCKSNNNLYKESINIINDALDNLKPTSPIREEFLLLKSQSLVKYIHKDYRKEAVEILSYDESDNSIDEYLRYRVETRKIAALIHYGEYEKAKHQSDKMENKFLKIFNETHSPGIEYYLNVIYRKYSNIHSYESSITAINKSVKYFSKNKKYIKETYISLNNALALNLINGNPNDAYEKIKELEKLKEKHFNYRFPRQEIYKNNKLIYELVYGSEISSICNNFKTLYEETQDMADNIFICSNYSISLALTNNIKMAVSILEKKYNDLSIKKDREGIYKYRIYCNYAILKFILNNNNKEEAINILNDVHISKQDLHYFERSVERNTIIKTLEGLDKCNSAIEWMEKYKSNIKSIKKYYCLYQQGFVFTTLFDWDDE